MHLGLLGLNFCSPVAGFLGTWELLRFCVITEEEVCKGKVVSDQTLLLNCLHSFGHREKSSPNI